MESLKVAYVESSLSVSGELAEVVVALLAEIGYEAFETDEEELRAYIPATDFDEAAVLTSLSVLSQKDQLQPRHQQMEARNYNAEWERDYHSVEVESFCQIVPSFREPRPGFEYTLIIDPKMSFGTGHHETTRLMIRQMANLSFAGKRVLDMGCGTGILGILAAQMGATEVLGIDIDGWSFENAQDNFQLNSITQMQLQQGDRSAIPAEKYDVILANINRNVLLADIPVYASHLNRGGVLVVSGFYESDVASIVSTCRQAGLEPGQAMGERQWVSIACKH